MKKILFVVDERKMGGVSILLEDYLKNIDRNNKKIDVLVLHNNGDRLENLPNDVNIIFIKNEFDVIDYSLKQLIKGKKFFKSLKKILFSIYIKNGYIEKIIKNVRKRYNLNDYDMEIAFKDGFCQIFTAYGNSKKKITWLHNDYSNNNFIDKYKNTFVNVHEKFDKIVAISSEVKENFCNIYKNEDKIVIINNYIDEEKVKSKSIEECDLEVEKNKINLLSVGRLSYEKGYDMLLNALYKLKEEYKDLQNLICVNILGDGIEELKLKHMRKEYDLEDVVNFLGRVNNPYKYIQKHDMMIIPSRYESYCNVRIESLINKVPVLTTNVATTNEIMAEGKYGIIVENNEDGLYKGIKGLLNKEYDIQKYKEAVRNYSYTQKNEEIIKEVNKLLEIDSK